MLKTRNKHIQQRCKPLQRRNKLKHKTMLTKEKCIQAIRVWKETRTNFSKINEIIDPTAVFNFTQDDCDWIRENNKNSNFHTYAGVHTF